jgi:hypothetical protein
MDDAEIDEFLSSQAGCRVATVNQRGPHITGMAFVWVDGCVWVTSNVRTQRFVDIQRDPRVAVHFEEVAQPIWLTRFVEVLGDAEPVGEVPRIGEPNPELERIERIYAEKYGEAVLSFIHDGPDGRFGGHGWLKITPRKIISKTGSTIRTAQSTEA